VTDMEQLLEIRLAIVHMLLLQVRPCGHPVPDRRKNC
jgi:hypothetical protein